MSTSRPNRPARPSAELVAAQRAGKLQWRRAMVHRPFKEKMRTGSRPTLDTGRLAPRGSLTDWQLPSADARFLDGHDDADRHILLDLWQHRLQYGIYVLDSR